MDGNASATVSARSDELAALVDAIPEAIPAGATALRGVAPRERGPADRWARQVLRIKGPTNGQADVHNIFSSSIALSATRCLLTYIVLPLLATLPVLAPLFGSRSVVGSAIGIPVGMLALVFDVRAIRRFFQAEHRWRWVAALLYLAIMAMVASLVFGDISRLA